MKNDYFEELFKTITLRQKSKNKNSYTKKLLNQGPKIISQKVGEESAELIIDYLKGTKKRTVEEAVDLIYHVFVLLRSKKITFKDIEKEINKRKNVRRK
tara:strand:+ start:294 stop:590 length:297 start_codon:yes stop_codon:yes gene_type:complete